MKSQESKIKQELTKLWTGEFVAVISFWICFFIFKKWLINTKMLISVIYPLTVLSFILIQGLIYWLILLKRLSTPKFAITNTKKIYSILKIVDFLLLCVGIPIVILNYVNVTVMISAIFILAFAVIEWINYYKIRLSYSYNPLVLLRHIKNRKLSKSRLDREISER